MLTLVCDEICCLRERDVSQDSAHALGVARIDARGCGHGVGRLVGGEHGAGKGGGEALSARAAVEQRAPLWPHERGDCNAQLALAYALFAAAAARTACCRRLDAVGGRASRECHVLGPFLDSPKLAGTKLAPLWGEVFAVRIRSKGLKYINTLK